jgi:ribosomal protein L37E
MTKNDEPLPPHQIECPRCGAAAEAEHADLGVRLGTQQVGPHRCTACGWSDEEEMRSIKS